MTLLEELQSIISDMHKDAYGFRPRGEDFWAPLTTIEACREKLEDLDIAVGAVIAEDNRREVEAVKAFEAAVQRTIEAGAGDRDTAIRWLRESHDDEQVRLDCRYYEFLMGIPYGYLDGVDMYGTGWKQRVAA